MAKKDIDWNNLGFGYVKTDKRYVSNFKDGAWDDGALIDDDMITISECACVLQYAQTVFEGLKAYTTEDGRVVCFRPDLNASRLADSASRLEMPVFPEDRFVDAIAKVVEANIDYVPPYVLVQHCIFVLICLVVMPSLVLNLPMSISSEYLQHLRTLL